MSEKDPLARIHWPDYYAVTEARAAHATLMLAADSFGEVDPADPPLAVDLGTGAGRDARELLRRGWRVVAVDLTREGIEQTRVLTPQADRPRLQTYVADLADFQIPVCDLVNANLVLPFLPAADYEVVWRRIRDAVAPGGRFSGILFGDRDESAGDPTMTCLPPDVIRGHLAGFDLEYWAESEEDGETALGEPHHWHLIDVVAMRRDTPSGDAVG